MQLNLPLISALSYREQIRSYSCQICSFYWRVNATGGQG